MVVKTNVFYHTISNDNNLIDTTKFIHELWQYQRLNFPIIYANSDETRLVSLRIVQVYN